MSDKVYLRNRATAARWMRDRADQVTWWRWQVLTKHNGSDPARLDFSDQLAQHVFVDLAEQRLLLPVMASDGSLAYALNLGSSAWSDVLNPPNGLRKLRSFIGRNAGLLMVTVVTAAVTAVVTVYIEKLLGE